MVIVQLHLLERCKWNGKQECQKEPRGNDMFLSSSDSMATISTQTEDLGWEIELERDAAITSILQGKGANSRIPGKPLLKEKSKCKKKKKSNSRVESTL